MSRTSSNKSFYDSDYDDSETNFELYDDSINK